MGSDAMMCVPNFIKIGSGIQKLVRGKCRHTDEKIEYQVISQQIRHYCM
jgi:hypothetical protein